MDAALSESCPSVAQMHLANDQAYKVSSVDPTLISLPSFDLAAYMPSALIPPPSPSPPPTKSNMTLGHSL